MKEFELLAHIRAAVEPDSPLVQLGPGDDMALLRLGGCDLLVSIDQVVDGRHVRCDTTPLSLVGRKAVARALSDVAAMAARPVACLAAVTLPRGMSTETACRLHDAIREAAVTLGAPLVGGDFATHADDSPLVCTVTVLAEPPPEGVVTRRGAVAGDSIWVTGTLGGAWDAEGGGRHLLFTPRTEEAMALRAILGDDLHAMIDLSDGLGRDASHLVEEQLLQVRIGSDAVPCSEGVTWREAIGDGEDYELCFAATGEVPTEVLGCQVTRVGEVVDRPPGDARAVVFLHGDDELTGDELGWSH